MASGEGLVVNWFYPCEYGRFRTFGSFVLVVLVWWYGFMRV